MKIFIRMVAGSGLALALVAGAVAGPPIRQDQLEDIAVFRRDIFEPTRAYPPRARAEAERRLVQLERKAGQLSEPELIVEICRIAALADNGHSNCFFFSRKPGAPLGFTAMGGRFFVTAADPAVADLLGGELIGIDHHSAVAVTKAGRSLAGGLIAHRDLYFAGLLNRIDLLHALGVADSPEAARYRLRLPNGEMIERSLTPTLRQPGWLRLPVSNPTPWALQDPATVYRWRDAPELNAVVVQLRGNADVPNQKLLDFLIEAEANRKRLDRSNVVLDMRWNSGGNFLLNREFMRAWPSILPTTGRFFVLTGPATFSAGIASVAYLKQTGGKRVVLIGEPPGDRLMFFSEGDFKELPHSGVSLLSSTERHDWRFGCRAYQDCFVSVAQPDGPTATPPEVAAALDNAYGRIPLEVRSLDPNAPAPWTIRDYLDGQDPGMRAIADLYQRAGE